MTSTTKSDSDVASSTPPEPPKKQYSDLHIPSWKGSHDEEGVLPESSVVRQEEGSHSHGDEDRRRARSRAILCLTLISLAGLVLFIGLLSLSIWVSTLFKPQVSAESLEVESFYVGESNDASRVPTKLISVKCSLKIYIHNTVSTYGVQVRSSPVDLFYKDMAIAKGELRGFYLRKNLGRTASVYLEGDNVLLHKEGTDFPLNSTGGAVPLRLELDVVTRGDVLGPLVESKHSRHVSCAFNLDFAEIGKPIKLDGKACN